MNYFLYKLIPPRPTLAADMTGTEQAMIAEHVAYWTPPAGSGVGGGIRPGRRPGHVARAGMGAHGEAGNPVWLGVPAVVRYGVR